MGGGGGVENPVPIESNPGTVSDLVTCIRLYVTRAGREGDGKPAPLALDEIPSDIEYPKVQSFHGIISRIPEIFPELTSFGRGANILPKRGNISGNNCPIPESFTQIFNHYPGLLTINAHPRAVRLAGSVSTLPKLLTVERMLARWRAEVDPDRIACGRCEARSSSQRWGPRCGKAAVLRQAQRPPSEKHENRFLRK